MPNLSALLYKNEVLSKIRLSVYILLTLHIFVVSSYLFSIDFSVSKYADVRNYKHGKWILITTWFNLLMGPYLVMSVYCEWKELKGEDEEKIKGFNEMRSFIFTSLILPVTAFSDIFFWRLWNKDPILLMHPNITEVVPFWTQHSMHTVSLAFIIFDLLCVPRQRPRNITSGLVTLLAFLSVYSIVCFSVYLGGYNAYPFFKDFSLTNIFLCVVYTFISNMFYYTGQWIIVDFIWGQKSKENIVKMHSFNKLSKLNM